jgi:hypothetical protein
MQWLFNFDPQDWLAALRQSPWLTRVQVLLSAGLGLSGLAMYFAGECLRRLPVPASARSKR